MLTSESLLLADEVVNFIEDVLMHECSTDGDDDDVASASDVTLPFMSSVDTLDDDVSCSTRSYDDSCKVHDIAVTSPMYIQ